MTPEVAQLLEQRSILVSDVQEVIQHAETSGEKLVDPSRRRFKAAFRPLNVTFWMESSAHGEAFEIHNAYAHRMEIIGP